MKYNLEVIPKTAVTDRNGVKYIDFRARLKPNFNRVWRDIVLGYIALGALITGCVYIQAAVELNFWLVVACAAGVGLLMGYTIAYLQLFVHEAAHFNIHPDKKKNDRLANIFLCLMVGINIESYRQTHWDHHKNLGTTDDSENSYFNALTVPFVIQTLTGIHVVRVLLNRQKRIKTGVKAVEKSKTLAKKDKQYLVAGALLNLCIVSIAALLGQWVLVLAWVSAMGIFFPFFATLRQLLEHRDELASAKIDYSATHHGPVVRIFKDTALSQTFGGAGFVNHMLHHWDPTISYTNLPEVKKFLLETDQCGPFIKESTTTYTTTFFKLLKAD